MSYYDSEDQGHEYDAYFNYENNKKDHKNMASNDTQTIVIRGEASYAKIVGDPRLNYNKDGKEWSLDLKISKDVVKELKSYGLGGKIKMKPDYLDGAPYIRFNRKELDFNGKPNKPIEIVDILGKPWDDSLLGNGSVLDVKFRAKDYGPGKQIGVYIQKVRVMKHIPYEGQETMPEVSEDDEFFAAFAEAQAEKDAELKEFNNDFGLDDDLDDPVE